jgi:hypothetical protein
MANLPGRAIPGYEGRYSMTADGTTWYAAGPGYRPLKPQRELYIMLRNRDHTQTCFQIRTIYERVYGAPLDALPAFPPPGYDGPPPPAPEPDECGYEPLPGMTDDEAWPEGECRRVVWGDRLGTAIGARAWRWWVVLDGEAAPCLFSPSALAVSPGPEWEAEWKRLRAAEEARIAADVASEALFLRKSRAALGRGEYAGRKVVAG